MRQQPHVAIDLKKPLLIVNLKRPAARPKVGDNRLSMAGCEEPVRPERLSRKCRGNVGEELFCSLFGQGAIAHLLVREFESYIDRAGLAIWARQRVVLFGRRASL